MSERRDQAVASPSPQVKLRVVPCTLDRAREYVEILHRHHTPDTTRTRWALAVADDLAVVHGIALVGYPVARFQDDGWTLEVQRVATDGQPNACSILYGAAAKLARYLGFHRIITYIREDEPGTTLRAAGWLKEATPPGTNTWSRPNIGRVRIEKTEPMRRTRWAVTFSSSAPIELSWPHRPVDAQMQIEELSA